LVPKNAGDRYKKAGPPFAVKEEDRTGFNKYIWRYADQGGNGIKNDTEARRSVYRRIYGRLNTVLKRRYMHNAVGTSIPDGALYAINLRGRVAQ